MDTAASVAPPRSHSMVMFVTLPSAEPGRPSQGVLWASTTQTVFVPEVRFELTRPRGRPILSRLRLPFRHSGPVKGTREQV